MVGPSFSLDDPLDGSAQTAPILAA